MRIQREHHLWGTVPHQIPDFLVPWFWTSQCQKLWAINLRCLLITQSVAFGYSSQNILRHVGMFVLINDCRYPSYHLLNVSVNLGHKNNAWSLTKRVYSVWNSKKLFFRMCGVVIWVHDCRVTPGKIWFRNLELKLFLLFTPIIVWCKCWVHKKKTELAH